MTSQSNTQTKYWTASPPQYLDFQIHLTDDCNLNCLHCYLQERGNYLTSEQFDHILFEVMKYADFLKTTPRRVAFCGGEPTLSPILFESIRKCTEAGFNRVALLTNGQGFTNDFVHNLVQAGCRETQICIEGKKETHNAIRNGSWDEVLQAWDICQRNGMHVVSQTCINPLNYNEVNEVVNTCRGRVHLVRFLRQIPHKSDIDTLTPSQWLYFVEQFLQGLRQYGRRYKDFVIIKDIYWSNVFQSMTYRCPFNMKELPTLPIIECNGDVYLCRRSNVVVGNIFEESLSTIYENSEIWQMTRSRENGNSLCKRCVNSELCGGCRGMALAVNGDVMSEDPHCIFNKENKNWAKDIMKGKSIFPQPQGSVIANTIEAEEAAEENGISVTSSELQSAVDAFRISMGLQNAKDTMIWLDENGIALESFEEFIETNLIINKYWQDAQNANQAGESLAVEPIVDHASKRDFRNSQFNSWDKTYAEGAHWEGGHSDIIPELVNFLKVGDRILDLGCGSGRDSIFLAQKGFQVWGVDSSNDAIMKAKANSNGLATHFSVGSIESLPFGDEAFDVVTSASTLHCCPLKPVASEIFRILKRNGLAFLLLPLNTRTLASGKTVKYHGKEDFITVYQEFDVLNSYEFEQCDSIAKEPHTHDCFLMVIRKP